MYPRVLLRQFISIYRSSFEGLAPQVWYMALMMLVNRMGSLILPFLTLYTTQSLGWSLIDSGIASAAFGMGSMCGAYLGGIIVDRLGYFKVIVIGQFGAGIAFLCLQLITTFYPLCIALFLAATISDILRPGVMTGVAQMSSPQTKTRAISLMRMSFNLGLAIGPAFAGLIIAATSYRSIFILDGLTCLAAGIFALIFIERKSSRDASYDEEAMSLAKANTSRTPYTDWPFMLFMLCSLIMLIAFFQILFTVPVFMKTELGLIETDVGLFFAINGLLIFLSEMPIVHEVERRWRLMPAMILGSVMIGVSYLMLGLSFGPWVIIGLYALLVSYGEIVNFPFITSLTLRRARGSNLGSYMGLQAMLFSLSLILAPIIGSRVIDGFGYNALWLVAFILCVIAAIGWYFLDEEFRLKNEK